MFRVFLLTAPFLAFTTNAHAASATDCWNYVCKYRNGYTYYSSGNCQRVLGRSWDQVDRNECSSRFGEQGNMNKFPALNNSNVQPTPVVVNDNVEPSKADQPVRRPTRPQRADQSGRPFSQQYCEEYGDCPTGVTTNQRPTQQTTQRPTPAPAPALAPQQPAQAQRDLFDETGTPTQTPVQSQRDLFDETGTPTQTPVQPNTASNLKPGETLKADDKSFLRKHMWGNSFDEASDASFKAAQSASKCAGDKAECESAMNTAKSISKTQSQMADVSRVSDAAALASVGGSAYAELIKKNETQSGSLRSVANIHDTAAKAQLVTGVTDIALGSAAYLDQKKRLEKELDKVTDPQKKEVLLKQYQAAVEKTKAASMKHIGWGVAKLGASALSKAAAKSARNQADALESWQNRPAPEPVISGITNAPYYGNNSPQFGTATTSSSVGMNAPGASGSGTPSTGGSVAPSSGSSLGISSRSPASKGSSSGFSVGSSGASTGGASGAAAANKARDPAMVGVQPHSDREITYGMGGGTGGGSHGGASASADATGGLAGIVSSLLGGKDEPQPAPGQGLQAGMQANGEYAEESGEPGVVGQNGSLFDQVKAKHMKALAQGKLIGVQGGAH